MARKRAAHAATMHDVAALAGVSQATVSLVINDIGGSRVAEATKARVRDAALELGYRTNAFAQTLRRGESGIIGLVSDEVATAPFAGLLLKGAQLRAWERGHVILAVDTFRDESLERAALEMMQSYRVAGIIYASMYHRYLQVPEQLADIPTVVANAQEPSGLVSSVFPDEELGGYTATRHLIEAGHRRIAMINIQPADSGLPAGTGRLAGYRRALTEAGVFLDPDLERDGMGIVEDGRDQTLELMALPEPPTAIFAGNDRTAWGAYRALSELGLRVGADCSIVGFDNQGLLAPNLDPGLTTMALPFEQMGRRAVDLALDSSRAASQEAIECELVVRGSVSTTKVS